MPPAVPVVSTSFGRTSPMICFHSSAFGSTPFAGKCLKVSCDRCDSDLKTTTFLPPIVVVQNAPSRFALTAGEPLLIWLDSAAKLWV